MYDRAKFLAFEGIDEARASRIAKLASGILNGDVFFSEFVDVKEVTSLKYFHKMQAKAQQGASTFWNYPRNKITSENVVADLYWVQNLIAWYSSLEHCKINPTLKQGQWVFIGNWIYKFLIRLTLSSQIDACYLRDCFDKLRKPDLVIFLDTDPVLSAKGKQVLHSTELSSNNETTLVSTEKATKYQQCLREQYAGLAANLNWKTINTNNLNDDQILNKIRKFVTSHIT